MPRRSAGFPRHDCPVHVEVLSEHGALAAVLVKHARDAFVSDAVIASQWKQLNFSAPPDFSRALREYDRFLEIVADSGCEIVSLPQGSGLTLDSIYTRDAAIVSADGVILASMGKASRAGEPAAQDDELATRRAGRLPDRLRRRAVSKAAISSGSIRGRSPWGWAPAPMTKAFDS